MKNDTELEHVIRGSTVKFFIASFFSIAFLFSSAAIADDFCSQFTWEKDCAELGCNWLYEEQVCVDIIPEPTPDVPWGLDCIEITNPNSCELRDGCFWMTDICVDKY